MKYYVLLSVVLTCILIFFFSCEHEKHYELTGSDGELCASEAVWSHGQGDLQNTGRATGLRKQECYSGPKTTPQVKWTFSLGGALSANAPAIDDDGTIYLVSEYPPQVEGGGVRNGGLLAINPSGNLKWAFTKSYDVGPAVGTVYVQSPAIGNNGMIYFALDFDSTVYGINSKDGTEKWSYHVNSTLVSSPVVDNGGNVYVVGDAVYCFSPNGQIKWKFVNDTPISYCTRIVLGKTLILCGFNHNGILALDYNGNKQWLYPIDFDDFIQYGILMDEDENCYFKTDSYQIVSLDKSGNLRWNKIKGQVDGMTEPVLRGTNIYFGSITDVVRFDKDSGGQDTVLNYFNLYLSVFSSPLVDDDGVIYAATRFTGCCKDYSFPDNYPQVFAINSDGKELWRIALPDAYHESIYSYMALSSDGTLYLATFDEGYRSIFKLYALK
jgi:outer membrane protein assembly factor BamB